MRPDRRLRAPAPGDGPAALASLPPLPALLPDRVRPPETGPDDALFPGFGATPARPLPGETLPTSAPGGNKPVPDDTSLPVNDRTLPADHSSTDRSSSGSSGSVTVSGDGAVTAAQRLRWGPPARVENFDAGLAQWNVYDGPGHADNGRRSPSAATVQGGVLTISGNAQGTTAGMAWNFGSRYGRWEGRMRAPASDPGYHALMLLWPDAEDFPVGGEIDFVEMLDHTRQQTDAFVHYGANNSQANGGVRIDATQWHNWAVEWTPHGITTFVDGQLWWSTTDTSILPPRSMHLCLQLDWFPMGRVVTPSQMFVDWVAFYPVSGSGPGAVVTSTPGATPTPTRTTPTTPTPTTPTSTSVTPATSATPTTSPTLTSPAPTARTSEATTPTTTTPLPTPTPATP